MLPALVAYDNRQTAKPPPMYQLQPVRYVLRLTQAGEPLPPIIDRASKEAKNGPSLLAPHIKRASGIRSKLLADNAEYALGIARATSRPERVEQQHAAFIDLVAECAAATDEEAVDAVRRFLAGGHSATLPLPEGFDPAATITFQVNSVFPFELPAVQRFWARATGADGAGDQASDTTASALTCIVCGKAGGVLRRHPLKIKGIPGGQIGKDLISANAGAFESYGLQNSEIAPTCHTCAEAYGNALNALLAGRNTHLRLKDAVYVFWTVAETSLDVFSMFSDPAADPEQVRRLIDAARAGRSASVSIDDPTAFYATCLGPSGARVVVREWIDTTVGAVQRSLGSYFALQDLVAPDGTAGQPLPIFRLANATLGPGSDPPQQRVTAAIFRTALAGTPLPLDLLAQAVRRVRAEAGTRPGNRQFPLGVERDRAVLIKMVINSQPQGGTTVSSSLDQTSTDPAYLCGRLLAVIDAIQRRALGQTNATVIDKFYGSASSTPAAVFGTLIHNTQNHLAKLRKNPRHQGAAVALERRIAEIMRPLASFPATLTLPEQGMFALGYYHQRADDERARRERNDAPYPEGDEPTDE